VIDKDGKAVHNGQAPTFGLNWAPNDTLSPLRLREGRKPTGPGEVAVDANTFKDRKFAIGDQVQVVTPSGSAPYTIVGDFGFGSEDNIAGATLTAFATPVAQQVMDRVGLFDSIDVQAAADVGDEVLQQRIQAALPDGYEAITGSELTSDSTDAIANNLRFFNVFLLVFAFIALFVGVFIIYNTFSIIIQQRTRELALMRALGASAKQVRRSVIGESFIVGLLASAVGLGLGVVVAIGLKALMDAFGFSIPSKGVVVLARTVIVSLVVGTAVAVLSALLPAVRAARIPPVAAMRDWHPSSRAAAVRRNIIGLVLIVVGVALCARGWTGTDIASVGLGALLGFVGVIMVVPVLTRPVAGAIGRPVARFKGVTGGLAAQNATRSARRTAATASALMIGLALVAVSMVFAASLVRSVSNAVDEGATSDFVVRSDSNQQTFSAAAAEALRTNPELAAVYSYRSGKMRYQDATKKVTGIDAAALDPNSSAQALDIDIRSGDIQGLDRSGIAVYDQTLKDQGWQLGDVLPIEFPNGPQDLTIVATFHRTQLVDRYIVSLDTYAQGQPDPTDFLELINLAPGVSQEQGRAVITRTLDTQFPGLKVQTRAEYISDVKDQVRQLQALVYGLLALSILIAVFGVANTLVLSIVERTRELGLLRASGMTRAQMRSMVRWESVIMAVFGAVLGVVLGTGIGSAFVGSLSEQGFTDLVIPPGQLVLVLVVGAILGVIAAAFPARRAARLNILEAIATE
jgi:putative ABC transport system permease protein